METCELEELSVETINPAASPSLGSKNISTITANCSDWIRRATWQGIFPPRFDDILTQGSEMPWTIVFNLSGTGYFDLVAYQQFNDGVMTDIIPSDEAIAEGLAKLPKIGNE